MKMMGSSEISLLIYDQDDSLSTEKAIQSFYYYVYVSTRPSSLRSAGV